MGCGGTTNDGQCPECCGKSPNWIRNDTLGRGLGGHKPKCKLADAIEALGRRTLRIKE